MRATADKCRYLATAGLSSALKYYVLCVARVLSAQNRTETNGLSRFYIPEWKYWSSVVLGGGWPEFPCSFSSPLLGEEMCQANYKHSRLFPGGCCLFLTIELAAQDKACEENY